MTKKELKRGLNYHLTRINMNIDNKINFDNNDFKELLEEKEITLYGKNGKCEIVISEENEDYEIQCLEYFLKPKCEYLVYNDNFLDFDKDWLLELHNQIVKKLKKYFTDKEVEKLLKDKQWNNTITKGNIEFEVYIDWDNGYIVDLPYDIYIKKVKGW